MVVLGTADPLSVDGGEHVEPAQSIIIMAIPQKTIEQTW